MPHARPGTRKKTPTRVLALPDLEHAKSAVLRSLTPRSGQRTCDHAIREFVARYCSEPRLAFNRTVVLRYRIHLEQREGHWVIADLVGKGGRVRTVPIPAWVKSAVVAVEEVRARHDGQAVAIVSHGDVVRALVMLYLGMPADFSHRVAIEPASISIVDLANDGAPRVVGVNLLGSLA